MRTIICDLTREELAAVGARADAAVCREELEAARGPLGDLSALVSRADELWVVSENAFGGPSPLVARALGRADRSPVVSWWLYGPSTGAERACFRDVAAAAAEALGAREGGVWFPADGRGAGVLADAPARPSPVPVAPVPGAPPRRVALVCADPGEGRSVTAHLLADLAEALPVYARMAGVAAPELVGARRAEELRGCDAAVLGYPLRPGGLPGGLVGMLGRALGVVGPGARVYALCSTSLCDPGHALTSLSVVENFCTAAGARWMGGVAVGAGDMVLAAARSPRMGMMRRGVSEAVDRLVMAVLAGADAGVIKARPPVPRLVCRLAGEALRRRAGGAGAGMPRDGQ